jgi:hypothetical protein
MRTSTKFERRDRITDEIRAKADLRAIVDAAMRAMGKRGLVKHGREFRGPCPLHDGDGDNFAVNPAKGVFHCHTCTAAGDVFAFVQQLRRCDFPQARQWLAGEAGVMLDPLPGYVPPPIVRPTPPPAPSPLEVPAGGWSARTGDDRERCAAAWRALAGQEWHAPATIYTALRDALGLSDAAAAYLEGRGIDPAGARALSVRSIDDWPALPDLLLSLGFEPWECVQAGLHVFDRYQLPDGSTGLAASRSPQFAHAHIPALAFFYVGAEDCALSLRLRALADAATMERAGLSPAAHRYLSLRGNTVPVPWGADALGPGVERETLHIAEGEPDALTLRLYGARSLGIPARASFPGATAPHGSRSRVRRGASSCGTTTTRQGTGALSGCARRCRRRTGGATPRRVRGSIGHASTRAGRSRQT